MTLRNMAWIIKRHSSLLSNVHHSGVVMHNSSFIVLAVCHSLCVGQIKIKYRNKEYILLQYWSCRTWPSKMAHCRNLSFFELMLSISAKLTYLIARWWCGDGGGGGARAELGRFSCAGAWPIVERLSISLCLVMMLMVHPSNEWRWTRPDGL